MTASSSSSSSSSPCNCTNTLPTMQPSNTPADKNYSLYSEQLRIASIFIMFIASLLGTILPLWYYGSGDQLSPKKLAESHEFRIVRCFAAGIMLGVAFCHLLNDGVARLIIVCPNYGALAFTLACGGVILVLGFEQVAVILIGSIKTTHDRNSKVAITHDMAIQSNVDNCEIGKCPEISSGAGGGGHQKNTPSILDINHGIPNANEELQVIVTKSELGHRGSMVPCEHHHAVNMIAGSDAMSVIVKAYMMELSVATHSVIIGLNLGSLSGKNQLGTLQALMVAIVFHQFFEGIGLGSTIQEARLELGKCKVALFVLTFALTVSVGIVIGFLVDKYPRPNEDPLIVETNSLYITGVLNSVAAGVLVYVSLVEMAAEEFQSASITTEFALKAKMYIALSLGTFIMAIIAIWS